jgi:asparagine synthase (glutamine-hydrolysing)
LKLRTARHFVQYLGPGWLAYRLWYAGIQKTGVLRRRTPVAAWDELSLASFADSPERAEPHRLAQHLKTSQRFFFSPDDRSLFQSLLVQLDGDADWAAARIEELASGQLRLFSGELRDCGWPPRWQAGAIDERRDAEVVHFSQIDEFEFGDVKVIWEPSRFSFVFDLVRIYWRTGDERCPAMFWQAVEDWRRHNPPNTGVNWKCGQETALRVLAWFFGMRAFLDSAQTTPERLSMLTTMIAVSAVRIEANIRYALSQKNNHGISEAAGLLTVGLLLPMLQGSDRWVRKGRRLLEKQARELIYEDGGFSQYSANYHRVMLDVYIWAIRLAESAGQPLSRRLVGRVCRAARFLLQIQDRKTGGVPRYGHDDGALVLPLANCGYDDYRPVLQAAAALYDGAPLPYGPGPWDEKLLWLFGPGSTARGSSVVEAGDTWKSSGYGLLRRGDSFAFVRGGRFRHRPSHADLLHVDIWWRGRNIAIDPGTYSYNPPGPWQSIPLAGTACHNTVGVDGLDQAERVNRFLFLPWPKAPRRRLLRSPGGQIGLLELEHDGYERLADPVTHRRTVVQLGPEHWLVADELMAAAQHDYRLHWLFADTPADFDAETGRLTLTSKGLPYSAQVLATEGLGLSLARAEKESARGWYAPRYQHLAPALSLVARARSGHFRFFSVLGPDDWWAELAEDCLRIAGNAWQAEVGLAPIGAGGPVTVVRWDGRQSDQLELS